jgi:hypothetical protein
MVGGLLDDGWRAIFESGSAHIVGFASDDGMPFATRGWGMRVAEDGSRATILLGATEVRGSLIAVTCTDVRTLRGAQVKGAVLSVRPFEEADRPVLERYCDEFFNDVLEVDLISRTMMERLVPDELVACTFAISEAYDQTPGPGAGRPLGAPVP